jgi:hypothetical protein
MIVAPALHAFAAPARLIADAAAAGARAASSTRTLRL